MKTIFLVVFISVVLNGFGDDPKVEILSHENLLLVNDEEQAVGEFTVNSNLEEVERKFRWASRMDNTDFEKSTPFDYHYNGRVTKFSSSDKKDASKSMSAVVYKDRIRLVKSWVMRMTKRELGTRLTGIRDKMQIAVDNKVYTVVSNNYLRLNQTDNNWIQAMVIVSWKASDKNDLIVFTSPERDFNYLKHSIGVFQNNPNITVTFLVPN